MFKCLHYIFGFCVLLSCVIGNCTDWEKEKLSLQANSKTNGLGNDQSMLHVKFKVKDITNQFIVHFRNFYWAKSRIKFLCSSFLRANISQWAIIPRINPASNYPSDFEVLQVSDNKLRLSDLLFLEQHPAIKHVSVHRSVQRSLNYIPYSNMTYDEIGSDSMKYADHFGRHLLRTVDTQITTTLRADILWDQGITGKGVKVAVFDTGLAKNHPHFRHVKERTNWTNEKSLDDGVSHGTFVAGVIASAKECLGIAPDADLHIYRVFTNAQVSYTSWFLDAFNYAIFKKINILNLSIGGPDFLDRPFVDKVLELSANKIIMVSAIGNDGPLYGTLNNPGDQSDVIGVGGVNADGKVAKFSSRGMTTWELPLGYGRLKPDIVTFGSQVKGSNIRTGCRSLSGTSVASPVVAGAITLITSGALHNLNLINPSSMKQILIEGATRLSDNNMFEQGHGKLNILRSMKLLSSYTPKVTFSPAYLDFTDSYMWPYSSQSLFCKSMPVIVNVTILNGIAVTGKIIEHPKWHSYADKHGNFLDVAISFSPVLWPWSGWMAIHLGVKNIACDFEGVAHGHVSLVVQNPSAFGSIAFTNSTIYFPLSVKIIPSPPRHKRILWDQYHSLRYPPGYIPRDNLKMKSDPLDWRADHIHTNFRDMYIHLRNSGFYVDILRMPFTCFNASNYGTLLLVDPEEEFFNEEIFKIQNDVYDHGLSIILFADWYNTTVMKKIKFFDENTRQWWIPDTGGTNIPAVNELLSPFGTALDDFVAEGHFRLGDHEMYFASGSTIAKFPEDPDNIVIGAELNDQGMEIIENVSSSDKRKYFVPILGLFQTKNTYRKKYTLVKSDLALSSYEKNTGDHLGLETSVPQDKNPLINKRVLLQMDLKNNVDDQKFGREKQLLIEGIKYQRNIHNSEGRLGIFGDSNCLDSAHLEKACFWLLDALLQFTMNSYKSGLLQNLNRLTEFKRQENKILPLRLASSNLNQYSKVLDPKNKYNKMPLEKCERLHWTDAIVVNATGMQLVMDKVKFNILQNYHAKKDAGSLDYPDTYNMDLNHYINKDSLKKSQMERMFYSIDKDFGSINLSYILVMILTFIVLSFIIRCFKRKKRMNHFIL